MTLGSSVVESRGLPAKAGALRDRLRSASVGQLILILLLVVVLGYLIVVPLGNLLWTTLTWSPADVRLHPDASPGAFTLSHWERVMTGRVSEQLVWRPLRNSLVVGVIAAACALVLGAGLAWLLVRTDLPGRKRIRTALVLPYMLPSFAIALAWTTLFRSGSLGGNASAYESLFGQPPPDWLALGPIPIITVVTLHYFPFAFLVVSSALTAYDAQLEECAEILGASRKRILWRITLPIVLPSVASAFVLIFGKALGTFAAVAILGTPAGFDTLATMIYANMTLGLPANAFILALLLIVIASLVVYANSRITRQTSRFVTISGKGFKTNVVSLGPWRWPLFFVVVLIIAIGVVLPIALLVYQSIAIVPGVIDLSNVTSYFWVGESDPEVFRYGEPGVLHNPRILRATWNSIRLAGAGALISAFLGVLIGYLTVRAPWKRLGRLLDQIAFIPYLVPGIALGAVYLSMFAVRRGPIPPLFGTFALLLLLVVINGLPYTTRTGAAAVTQISKELEEAAELYGASPLRRFLRVVLPLTASGVASGAMITFIGIMRELSLLIMVITPSLSVLMSLSFSYTSQDYIQHGNALMLIVVFITMLGEIVLWRFGKGKLARFASKTGD